MAPPAVSSCSQHGEQLEDETQSTSSPKTAASSSSSSAPNSKPSQPQGGASSPEEIARQHEASLERISEGLLFSKPDWEGEIPLSAKRRPAIDCDEKLPCWSSRGQVDVSALQRLVQNGYNRNYGPPPSSQQTKKTKTTTQQPPEITASEPNYWDPAYAAVHNVAIRRPSHDAWGIPKIVLLFSDDFLHACYEFPFLSMFESALQPVLDCLNIPQQRVVRALLASLPPGTTIPLHHDTGEWVQHTHRVHVPILVQDVPKIVFTCGGHTIACRPGHVFEINNQCRHAVSNCDDDYRVHLILDYVDTDYCNTMKPRQMLQPGEVLYQTRRSIDRACDAGRRPTPSFLILGAQKAGTTFLFESIVTQHPWIVPPKNGRRETHCLDWRWNEALQSTQQRVNWCHQFYHTDELHRHPSCQTGDSTPSYLLDSARVIPRLKEAFPHFAEIKFLVTLRDPVRRAESHYAMVTSPNGTPAQLRARGQEWRTKTLDEVVMMDLRNLQDCGVLPYWSSFHSAGDDGMDDEEAAATSFHNATFDRERFVTFSGSPEEDAAWRRYLERYVPLHTGSYGLLSRGLYELNLRPWWREFGQNILVLQLETMSLDARSLQETVKAVWQHLDVPHYTIPQSQQQQSDRVIAPKNARAYDPLFSDATRAFLRRFYAPHNERLQRWLLQQCSRRATPRYVQTVVEQHWSEGWPNKDDK